MIKFFAGEDSYESFINAYKTASKISKEKNIEIRNINADEISKPEEFGLLVEGIDMFSSANLIFAKRLLKNKNLVEYIIEKFENFNQYDIIIWNDDKADGKTKLVKKLKSEKQLFIYDLPREWQINSWIENIAKQRKLALTNDQINFMVERLSINKWIIFNEIKKIELFLKANNKEKITNEELSSVLGFETKGDLWKFLDYFANKKYKQAIEEFDKLTKYENNVQLLIAMILRELNLIAKIKFVEENGIDYKNLKLHPFVLQKTISKSKNFNLKEIGNLIQSLLNIDYNIKTGKMNEQLGMIFYLTSNI